MDLLRKTYSDQRAEYTKTLNDAVREKDPERMKAYSTTLIDLNRQMSVTVSSMVSLVARTESRVNLDSLRDKLLGELVEIQNDVKTLEKSNGERKVLQSMYDQYSYQNSRNDWTIIAYLVALGIGMLLIVVTIIGKGIFTPAMPPLAIPVTSSQQGLL